MASGLSWINQPIKLDKGSVKYQLMDGQWTDDTYVAEVDKLKRQKIWNETKSRYGSTDDSSDSSSSNSSSSNSSSSNSSSSSSDTDYTTLLNTQKTNQLELMGAAYNYRTLEAAQKQGFQEKNDFNTYTYTSKLQSEDSSQQMERAAQQQRFKEMNDQNAFQYSSKLQAQGSLERMNEETHRTGQQIRVSDNNREAANKLWNNIDILTALKRR